MIGHTIDDLSRLGNIGTNAHSNRMLQEYYNIMLKHGKEAADMVYDAYNGAGRFMDGPNALDKGADVLKTVKKNPVVAKAGKYLDDAAAPVAAGLMELADKIPLGKGGATASRMAGGLPGKIISKALPVLGAVTAAGDVADIVLNDTSAGNKIMDTAAMGIGGTIGGVLGLGNPFAIAGGASIGKMASDATQFVLGGGKSPQERKLEEALTLLQARGLV